MFNFCSSYFWMFMIVIGAGIVAVSNIAYTDAKEREKGKEASDKIYSLLKTELNYNVQRLEKLKMITTSNTYETVGFKNSAWSVISSAGFLMNLESQKAAEVTEIYSLIEQSNHFQELIMEHSVGLSSSLSGQTQNIALFRSNLKIALDRLEPKLISFSNDASSAEGP